MSFHPDHGHDGGGHVEFKGDTAAAAAAEPSHRSLFPPQKINVVHLQGLNRPSPKTLITEEDKHPLGWYISAWPAE